MLLRARTHTRAHGRTHACMHARSSCHHQKLLVSHFPLMHLEIVYEMIVDAANSLLFRLKVCFTCSHSGSPTVYSHTHTSLFVSLTCQLLQIWAPRRRCYTSEETTDVVLRGSLTLELTRISGDSQVRGHLGHLLAGHCDLSESKQPKLEQAGRVGGGGGGGVLKNSPRTLEQIQWASFSTREGATWYVSFAPCILDLSVCWMQAVFMAAAACGPAAAGRLRLWV